MNGIFGGFLAIIDSIGGGILYILIGGAASHPGAGARAVRLLLGALIFGFLISAAIYWISPGQAFQRFAFQNNLIFDDAGLAAVFLPPIVTIALTAVLEILRFGIERPVVATEPKLQKTEAHGLRITPVDRNDQADRIATKRAA